jgi:hypothetical protein
MKVIDRMFDAGGAAESLSLLKGVAKATSCGICSHIAEEEGDYGFALKCAGLAVRYQPCQTTRWVRLVKSLIKYMLSLVGVKR